MDGRGELAKQGVIGGGYHLLAEVKHRDELARRVAEAVEYGEDPDAARKSISDEMVVERLVEAFGAEVVRLDPDEFGNPG